MPSGSEVRVDLRRIADMIEPNSRVLDIGCGSGELLDHLWREKNVDGRGIEISQSGVHACVSRGLSVIQGDADKDLVAFPSNAFTYAVLSQTLQAMNDPKGVLEQLVRIGRYGIVSFPNFAYWRMRMQLLVTGRMPVTKTLPWRWYDTPNIHFCTVRDFVELARELNIVIERSLVVLRSGRIMNRPPGPLTNWLGEQAIFLLRKDG